MNTCRRSCILKWLGGILLAILLLIIGGCRSAAPVHDKKAVDRDLEAASRAARFAFEKGQFEQAAALYQTVLERAYIRGDGEAIGDAKYNHALCLMELHLYHDALKQVVQAQTELTRSGSDIPPDFLLLEATILYRSNRLDEAWRVTSTLLGQKPATSSMVLMKTYFLRGLITSAQGNISRLKEAIAAMGEPASELLEADLLELRGRLALALNNWQEAAAYLAIAVQLRREHLNYRRMGIALALSAQAYEKSGDQQKAALNYLRAGRSAALSGDRANARLWLAHALKISQRQEIESISIEAQYHLTQLNQKQDLGLNRIPKSEDKYHKP
jgi:tetratricopeptide (TPR) repeat protein